MTDSAGLTKAYARADGVFIHNGTMYISGTKSLDDVMSWPSIPLGEIRTSTRYGSAQSAMSPDIHTVVGHSLGSSVAAELAQSSTLRARLYNSPRVSWSSGNKRIRSYAHFFDPVSAFDLSAYHNFRAGNPHSYRGYHNRHNDKRWLASH
jgi:hypothetical protein